MSFQVLLTDPYLHFERVKKSSMTLHSLEKLDVAYDLTEKKEEFDKLEKSVDYIKGFYESKFELYTELYRLWERFEICSSHADDLFMEPNEVSQISAFPYCHFAKISEFFFI